MNPFTMYRELAAAGTMLASYPLDYLIRLGFPVGIRLSRDAVILSHGLGGDRANLAALAAWVRLAGFDNVHFFEYPTRQPIDDSAAQLVEMIAKNNAGSGIHLIGHSLGGTISRIAASRIAAANISESVVRSLVTLAAPYRHSQPNRHEIAIFGDEDPIVLPPGSDYRGVFKRIALLRNTGHLGVLYHPETIRITLAELWGNRVRSA
jgi:pimeloyl-ACP methyl ester carboxylesterase